MILTGFNGVVAFGSFPRQHDTIRTIENGVGNVTDLSTSWPWIILQSRSKMLQCQNGRHLTVIDYSKDRQIHE